METSKNASPGASFRGEAAIRNRRGDLISQVIEDAPDAIWVWQASAAEPDKYLIAYANAAFERIYEVDRADAIGKEAISFLAGRSLAEDLPPAVAGLQAGKTFSTTRYHPRRDGRPMWLHVVYRPENFEGATGWIIASRDVTDIMLAQRRTQQLARAIEHINNPIALEERRDGTWAIGYVNRAFARLFRYAPEEIVGRTWQSFLAPSADIKRAEDCRVGLLSGQNVQAELPFLKKDGSEVLLSLIGTPIVEEGETLPTSAVTIFSDITEMRRKEDRLRMEVNLDPLTGLYNRREIYTLLSAAIRMTPKDKRAHVLLFIDLDGFKAVNDRHGHQKGDEVLIAAAQTLKTQLLPTDDLGRWGGDEFAAILYYYDLPNALEAAHRMIGALRNCEACAGVGASIGVLPIGAGARPETLIRSADALMYRAKGAGGNRVVTPEGE